jgi:hypothetical protein
MTPIEQRDQYIAHRLTQIRWWNRLGWLMIVLIVGLAFWLHQHSPLYFDPILVAKAAQNGQLPSAQMAQLAALGNLAFWGCLILMIGMIIQAYAAMYNEKKLIDLVQHAKISPVEESSESDRKTG